MMEPRGINSKHDPKEFLKRGFKSMFSNYDAEKTTPPPVNTKPAGKPQK
ncbi:hypothetical protein [Desulfovibrio sp. Huiquan2017]|nr:hypothetical protein [Desulfovibrio sp. Huiquan2017]